MKGKSLEQMLVKIWAISSDNIKQVFFKNVEVLMCLPKHNCTLINAQSPQKWKNAQIIQILSYHSWNCNHYYYG